MAHNESGFDETLSTRAILAVIETGRGIEELERYGVIKQIQRLQESTTSDKESLFKIEWNFLPWLDRFSTGSPVTLENRLSSDPSFFAELIRLVFRPRDSEEQEHEKPDKRTASLARNAYKLLNEWRLCPGKKDDGRIAAGAFESWIEEAQRLTEESGHGDIAQRQIGHVLVYAPEDAGGLWIDKAVANVLNSRHAEKMRSGFTTQLFNDRGVHTYTHGEEERRLAAENREKAESLEQNGFTRFAAEMREFAERYERQADVEEKRHPIDD